MAELQKDYEALRDGLEAALRGHLERLVEGGVAALDGPIREAANRLSVAARSGRRELADEARDQLTLALKEQAAKAKQSVSFGAAIGFVAGPALNLLLDGAVAGLGALVKKR